MLNSSLIRSLLFILLFLTQFKISAQLKPTLDSITFENQYKFHFKYDEKGNHTETITFGWDSTKNEWTGPIKSEWEYDDRNNMILYHRASYYNDKWNSTEKETYEYDQFNRKTAIYKFRNSEGSFTNNYREEYSYDDDRNYVTKKDYYWSNWENEWKLQGKEIQEFNDKKHEIAYRRFIREDDTTGQEYDLRLTEYVYDSEGKILQSLLFTHSRQTQPQLKTDYVYDSFKNLTQRKEYTWNSQLNVWHEYHRKDSLYNSNNQLVRVADYYSGTQSYKEDYEWNNDKQVLKYIYPSSDRIPSLKIETAYDERGNRTSYTEYKRDKPAQKWILQKKYFYNFDLNYKLKDVFYPAYPNFEFESYMNQVVLSGSAQSFENDTVYKTQRVNYYYSGIFATDLTAASEKEIIAVFPNPLQDRLLHIKQEIFQTDTRFELYDLTNRMISQQKPDTDKTVDLEGTASGVYIYKITSGGKVHAGKLILR